MKKFPKIKKHTKQEKSDKSDHSKTKLTKKQRLQIKRKQRLQKLREVKGQIKGQLTAAQSSTKSMGKFDRKAHKQERHNKPKQRKQHCHFTNIGDEVNRNMQILSMVKQSLGSKKVSRSL